MSDRFPTLADVCSAIAEGHIATTSDGMTYQVNALELRRFLNRFRALPALAARLAQGSSPHSATSDWSASAQTSLA